MSETYEILMKGYQAKPRARDVKGAECTPCAAEILASGRLRALEFIL